VRQIEKELSRDTGHGFECINAAISGLNSTDLLELYAQEWIILEPKLTVVILSNNERDADRFRTNMERLAEMNRVRGIQTLFVLEPNSPERKSDLVRMHAVLREVGEAHQVPVVDMHGHLRTHGDDGFLWWDHVHLTSFGHRLMTLSLLSEIRTLGFGEKN
jgi:hypothetical protein